MKNYRRQQIKTGEQEKISFSLKLYNIQKFFSSRILAQVPPACQQKRFYLP